MVDRDFEAKARTIANMTAKATVDRMMNQGIGLTLEEARSVAASMNSDASEFFCKGCGHPLSSDEVKGSRCGICGSRQATDSPTYRCASCKEPLSIKAESCPHCGCKDAIKSNSRTVLSARNPKEYFTCANCLGRVNLADDRCPRCGNETAYRTQER